MILKMILKLMNNAVLGKNHEKCEKKTELPNLQQLKNERII